jgi:hypothetical protein
MTMEALEENLREIWNWGVSQKDFGSDLVAVAPLTPRFITW